MDNLGVAEQHVYTGVWINWSRGKILGSTWTLPQREGNFLIAFLALFVSYAGTSMFRVTCFALHSLLSSKSSEDIIYHQRQVVLRNSASGTSALYSFTQLFFYWGRKGNGHRSVRRILPFVLHAAILTSIFAVAGVYSSRIAALEGEVLIASPHRVKANKTEMTTQDANIITPYRSSRTNAFSNYAQSCYSEGSLKTSCNTFVQSRIPQTIERNASCPFQGDICKSNNTNIKIDTGLLDSHSVFGINAPSSKRVLFRYVLQCAPVVSKGYTESYDYSQGSTALTYQIFNYGPITVLGEIVRNETEMFSEYSKERIRFENANGEYTHYGIATQYSHSANGSWAPTSAGSWRPLSALFRPNADTSLIFLVPKDILYMGQVDDPWYSAHQKVGEVTNDKEGTMAPVYQSDEPASPLGCTEQFQICLPNSHPRKCSPLSGLNDLTNFAPPLITEAEYNMTKWFARRVTEFPVPYILETLGGEALTSKYSLLGLLQAVLPNNQWQTDVIRLFDIVSSSMQSATVDFATGPADKRLTQWEWYAGPTNKQEEYFAHNQKIRSTAYANFSVFGLSITLVIGGLIVLLELFIETLYKRWLWRFHSSHPYPQMEWCTNGTLQLQRLAHEEVGIGPWTACDEEIPIASQDTKLATLNLEDLKSPRLNRSTASDLTACDVQSVVVIVDSSSVQTRSDGNVDSSSSSVQTHSDVHVDSSIVQGDLQNDDNMLRRKENDQEVKSPGSNVLTVVRDVHDSGSSQGSSVRRDT